MQYTGLKDKNGKEIYEGDIIQHCVEINGFLDKEMWVISWTQNDITCGWNIFPGECCFCEVLGNIYESPNSNIISKN